MKRILSYNLHSIHPISKSTTPGGCSIINCSKETPKTINFLTFSMIQIKKNNIFPTYYVFYMCQIRASQIVQPILFSPRILLYYSGTFCLVSVYFNSVDHLSSSTLSITSSTFSFSLPNEIMGRWERCLLMVIFSLFPLCREWPVLLLSLSYFVNFIRSKSWLLLILCILRLLYTFSKISRSWGVSNRELAGSSLVCLFVFCRYVETE